MTDAGSLAICATPRCEGRVVIECQFQSLGYVRAGEGLSRVDRSVQAQWCWPCFALWGDQLKSLARRGIGLADGGEG